MIASPGLVPKKIRKKQEKNYHQDNQTPRISIADPHINTWVERDRKTIRAIPYPPLPPTRPSHPWRREESSEIHQAKIRGKGAETLLKFLFQSCRAHKWNLKK